MAKEYKKGTVDLTIRIPEDDLPLLETLKRERGWKEKNLGKTADRLKNYPRSYPPMSDEEIVAEVKAYRHGK